MNPSFFISATPFIAFSVAATQEETYTYGDAVKFHHVFSNVHEGSPGWDPLTNEFICPVGGYYLFTLTLYKHFKDVVGDPSLHYFYVSLRGNSRYSTVHIENVQYMVL